MYSLKRIAILGLLLLTLVGCGRAYSVSAEDVAPVDSAEVTRTLQFLDGLEEGPQYTVSLTVPDAWVGNFQTRTAGNVLYFDYTREDDLAAPIFSIEALSPAQYWQASGSYPAYQTNLVNKGDTFFVYTLPIDDYYSGLAEEALKDLSIRVPAVVRTFDAQALN